MPHLAIYKTQAYNVGMEVNRQMLKANSKLFSSARPEGNATQATLQDLITGSKSSSKERRPDTNAKHALRGRKSAEWGITLP